MWIVRESGNDFDSPFPLFHIPSLLALIDIAKLLLS